MSNCESLIENAILTMVHPYHDVAVLLGQCVNFLLQSIQSSYICDINNKNS
ncbi:hypothetical protein Plhal304r1_c004g0014741 [Plasmopara halstedii]